MNICMGCVPNEASLGIDFMAWDDRQGCKINLIHAHEGECFYYTPIFVYFARAHTASHSQRYRIDRHRLFVR